MNFIKKMYDENKNIMEFFRNINNTTANSSDSILYSYDIQTGSYIKKYLESFENNTLYMDVIHNGLECKLSKNEYFKLQSHYINSIFQSLDFSSFLDAGTGECSTLYNIFSNNLTFWKTKKIYAADISLSRVLYGKRFIDTLKEKINVNFFTGNLLNIPLSDSSIDVVFTNHAIEPNTDKEKEILQELYRIANKYLVLIEPSYSLGNEETKNNIDKHKYIKNLYNSAKELNYNIIDYRLHNISFFTNNSEIIIIKKTDVKDNEESSNITEENIYSCPVCKNKLIYHNNNYFCNNCFLLYPVINDIPILNKNNGILCSKYMEF